MNVIVCVADAMLLFTVHCYIAFLQERTCGSMLRTSSVFSVQRRFFSVSVTWELLLEFSSHVQFRATAAFYRQINNSLFCSTEVGSILLWSCLLLWLCLCFDYHLFNVLQTNNNSGSCPSPLPQVSSRTAEWVASNSTTTAQFFISALSSVRFQVCSVHFRVAVNMN